MTFIGVMFVMVETIKWQSKDCKDDYVEIALFNKAGVNFRVSEDGHFGDCFLSRDDVEDLVEELRYWLRREV